MEYTLDVFAKMDAMGMEHDTTRGKQRECSSTSCNILSRNAHHLTR
jgi:hypothetical protein